MLKNFQIAGKTEIFKFRFCKSYLNFFKYCIIKLLLEIVLYYINYIRITKHQFSTLWNKSLVCDSCNIVTLSSIFVPSSTDLESERVIIEQYQDQDILRNGKVERENSTLVN